MAGIQQDYIEFRIVTEEEAKEIEKEVEQNFEKNMIEARKVREGIERYMRQQQAVDQGILFGRSGR